jgi:hypothetical protein
MLQWNDGGRKRHQWEHRRIWEEAHGPIPAGHVIHHLNEDGYDNRLENLACVSRSEHAAIHKPLGTWAKKRPSDRTRGLRNLSRRIRELEAELAACREVAQQSNLG